MRNVLTILGQAARIGVSVAARQRSPSNTVHHIMSNEKSSLFVMPDGKNVTFTFIIVSSLFLLWGFGNGMIDVMDKHFQDELNLTLAQSANVQWAHYLGYFLMSIPAGWLASKLGYKIGIIVGLLMVAAGGLWFIPATQIAQFWAYLVGVCFIASGFTFLETIANPYTTVLGPQRYAATRINLAQSCNGIGWILGPIVGSIFFYSKDVAGQSTGSQTLWIPYAAIAAVVAVLATVFYFAEVPDIKAEDDYHLDDAAPGVSRSIWTHPHFVFAVLAQFMYVAAQAGIFSFVINYMTMEVPEIPDSWRGESTEEWFEVKTKLGKNDIQNLPALVEKLKQKSDPVSAFLSESLSEDTAKALADYCGDADARTLLPPLVQDLNNVVKQDPNKIIKKGPDKGKKPNVLADSRRFAGLALAPDTQSLLAQRTAEKKAEEAKEKSGTAVESSAKDKSEAKAEHVNLRVLNRKLLRDAYPQIIPFNEGMHAVSDKFASLLASFGFVCFLAGRFSGAGLLKKYSAHLILGLYGLLNIVVCLLIFCKLGWLSVACVFLSYFFMSIMFPTIFALGIFGLGARAKKASAYIVMAIMGGALLPKLMGYIGDQYDMSRGFIVPTICFVFVAFYGFCWPKLSGAESLHSVSTSRGH
jgi:fucose permease